MLQKPLSERLLLLLLAAVQFTHIMDFMVMMPLGPQLMRLFEIEPHQFSFLVAVYTFSSAIAGIAGALFIDRFDRRTALLFAYIGFLVGTLACALAPGYETLLIARAASGAFGGVAGSLVLTIIGDIIPPERRGGAIGMVMASFSFASVAGVPVGLWLAAKWSWHAPFLIIVAVGLIVLALSLKALPSMRGHMATGDMKKHNALAGVGEILSHANSRAALGFMMMMVFGHFILIPFLSPSLVANAGLLEDHIFWFYLAGGLASLFSAPYIGRLADRYGKKPVFVATILLSMIPVYFIANLGPTPLIFIVVLAAVFFMFAGGRFVPGQAIITSAVPARLRGSFMSLNNSVRDMAAGAASLIGGQIVMRDAMSGKLLHLPVLGWIAIGVSLLSILAMTRVKSVA